MIHSSYRHRWLNGKDNELTPSKAVCVGRNYVAHARELANPVPEQPLLFIKPLSAFVNAEPEVTYPSELGAIHYECELVVIVGQRLSRASEAEALKSIDGYGLGLDLTLRDVQSDLKAKGHPWERAKAFDGSCLLGSFKTIQQPDDLLNCEYRFYVNGELKQHGDTGCMIFPIAQLLSDISYSFTLFPGDVVMTGTPAGVGRLRNNDKLRLELSDNHVNDVCFKQL